ncbi:MAG: murein biosynthesis integral membrane protein MurJ [Legionellaceae bacterium]|nr:murein biosynthesis integral membrane protein MurJ [Legionellaceae bacterium]
MLMTQARQNRQQALLRSTSLVSLMTFVSRMLGFARDMVIAHFFGAQAGVDAFFVAFRIPNFMRRLFAEGAFAQAFVPVLAEYQKTRSIADVRVFIARIAGQLSAVLSVVTALGIVAAPVIIFIFAPGFAADNGRAVLASEMLRLTFPYLLLISLTAMAGAVLNTYGYFAIPALTPAILNITMISAAVYLSPYSNPPVVALAWGVLLAGVAQLLFQLPFLLRHGLLVRPQLARQDEGVRRVLRLMIPALFGVSVAQLNLMVDSIFASFLQIGSVSWLYYTDRLTDFPLGVFGVAIATVILPHLSRRYAVDKPEEFSRSLDWALRLVLLIALPAALGLSLFALPLISSCFAYGKFSAFDALQTQKSLIALGAGVPAFMLIKVLASGFYARQDIKTPVKIGAIAMLVNSLLCALLIWPLAHAGLALASALAGYVNCALLWRGLRQRAIYQPLNGWGRYLGQLAIANLGMAVYLFWQARGVAYWLALPVLSRLGLLLAQVAMAMLIYVLLLCLTGLRPAQFRGPIRNAL